MRLIIIMLQGKLKVKAKILRPHPGGDGIGPEDMCVVFEMTIE